MNETLEEQDFSEATTIERHQALELLGITIKAHKVSHELSKTGIRFQWNVAVTYNSKTETFDYSNGDTHKPFKSVYDREQFELWHLQKVQKKNLPTLVDVLWCLALDYEAGQLSPFELINEYGYTDTIEAEKTYHALQANRIKIQSLNLPIKQIQKITEGY